MQPCFKDFLLLLPKDVYPLLPNCVFGVVETMHCLASFDEKALEFGLEDRYTKRP